jgi:predicted nucleic acid-binding Zn ribbon protein
MKSLQSLLEKRKKTSQKSFSDKDVFYVFNRVIQEEFGNVGAEKFRANFWKNGLIFVTSESSVWANELQSNRSKIVRKINEKLGEGAVKGIKLK